MNRRISSGLNDLTKKALAVITTSIAALTSNHVIAAPANHEINPEAAKKTQTKTFIRQLVLKLNPTGNSSWPMHASHSSHSSHSSHYSSSASGHSSHSSHSSHYSSSPSYTTRHNTTPYPLPKAYATPVSPSPVVIPKSSQADVNPVLNRTLYKGCDGIDVQKLQEVLLLLGYKILVTGYFGDKTEQAVKAFQLENELKPDGRVGTYTYVIILSKLK